MHDDAVCTIEIVCVLSRKPGVAKATRLCVALTNRPRFASNAATAAAAACILKLLGLYLASASSFGRRCPLALLHRRACVCMNVHRAFSLRSFILFEASQCRHLDVHRLMLATAAAFGQIMYRMRKRRHTHIHILYVADANFAAGHWRSRRRA